MANDLTFVLRGPSDVVAAISALTKMHTDSLKPDFVCVIKPFVKNRSKAQNDLFHEWIKVISREHGSDFEWTKNEIKRKFLGFQKHRYKDHDGNVVVQEIIPESSKLNTKEMKYFMDQIMAWAATDMGITLPIPEDTAWSIKD